MTASALPEQIERASRSSGPIIITGEPGSGRTFAARRIHILSGRAGAFTRVDVEAIPAPLLSAELFGIFGGPFFPVVRPGPGRCEQAVHGTLCIKEPHLLDRVDQRYLVEFVQTGRVEPANRRDRGMAHYVEAVRVAAVLEWIGLTGPCTILVDDLRGRPDVIHIDVPPLRQRPDEIETLFRTFLREEGSDRLPDDAMLALLRGYSWPGNIAEMTEVAHRFAMTGELRMSGSISPIDTRGRS